MSECKVPPPGWRCTRPDAPHEGPCAAIQDNRLAGVSFGDDGVDYGAWVIADMADEVKRLRSALRDAIELIEGSVPEYMHALSKEPVE